MATGDNEALKNADLVQLTVPGGVYMLMTLELPTHLDAQAMRTVASTLASGMSDGSDIDDVKTSTYQGQPAVTFAVAGTGASAGKGFGVSSGTTFVLLIATGSADADHFFQSLTFG